VLAIGQPSHSWLSGQLARAWGNERFGAVEPFEEVCLAAEQHDIGMGRWDADPDRNPKTGLPYSFTEMPLELHLQQWSDGPRRLLVQSRYAALLASRHGSRLQGRRDPSLPGVREYLEEQRKFQQLIAKSLGADPALLERNHQLIWIWDFLSLALCLDWAPMTGHDVPTATEAVELHLAPGGRMTPWPFRDANLTVRCEGRRLQGPYRTDEAMREALAAAPWETLEFTLVAE
jgi:hypothetical protein